MESSSYLQSQVDDFYKFLFNCMIDWKTNIYNKNIQEQKTKTEPKNEPLTEGELLLIVT